MVQNELVKVWVMTSSIWYLRKVSPPLTVPNSYLYFKVLAHTPKFSSNQKWTNFTPSVIGDY